MELNFEDREYEERRQRNAERIARMRMEKQRQMKRRRMMKRLLPISFGVLFLIVIIFVVGNGLGDRADVNYVPQTEIVAQTEEVQRTEETETQEELPPQVYEFSESSDIVGIYSEEVISEHAILVDASTDTIIAKKDAYDIICPASMTKVLTVLVAAEHVTEAELDNPFTMTLEITDYAYVNDCSAVGFLDEEVITVRDLFYGTVLPSGGDAAVGLATYVAGSHEAFVEMMNEKLEQLGLSDTAHFTNCVGLYDKEHYCSVYDMAVIMRAAMENEMCREFLSARKYTTTPTEQHPEGITISNWFLRRIEDKDTGGEVIGAKTGYVVQSKSCAVSYATCGADKTPYICVTAGSNSSWRCIYDQVEIYTRYVPEGAAEVVEAENTDDSTTGE